MVGDGINDAPALAFADVGVALGAQGAPASSQAADVVLLVDRLDRLVDARRIAVRSRVIALQSVVAGMALSFVAMGFAAAGLLAPVAGALVQEAIDLAVVGNALRARSRHRSERPTRAAGTVSARFRAEHRDLLPGLDRIRLTADRLDLLPAPAARNELEGVREFLTERLPPTSSRRSASPTQIVRLAHLFDRLVADVDADGPATEDRRELRRVLYGLHAVLRLHFAQEEEAYLAVDPDADPAAAIGADHVHSAARR